jgi:uncharacterized protein YbjT (DUF2867 family)
MKILLTGATGYIAQRFLSVFVKSGHEVVCCVRDAARFNHPPDSNGHVRVIAVDFLQSESLKSIPDDIDVAYYLIHSMSVTRGDFAAMEEQCAVKFKHRIQKTNTKQVIYLSGIINDKELSRYSHKKAC